MAIVKKIQGFEFVKGKYKPKNKVQLYDLIYVHSIALDLIDISEITDLSGLFSNSNFKLSGIDPKTIKWEGLQKWDVSHVKNISYLFSDTLGVFERDVTEKIDLSMWDVSSVVNAEKAFYLSCVNFDLSKWNFISLVNARGFFAYSYFDNKNYGKLHQSLFRSLLRSPKLEDVREMFYRSKFNNKDFFIEWVGTFNSNFYNIPKKRACFHECDFCRNIMEVMKVIKENKHSYLADCFEAED